MMEKKQTTHKETQFQELVIVANKDGTGNAQGMMKYITDLMELAYNIGVSESSATIENLASKVVEIQQLIEKRIDHYTNEMYLDENSYKELHSSLIRNELVSILNQITVWNGNDKPITNGWNNKIDKFTLKNKK